MSGTLSKNTILKNLDNPLRVVLWDWDEFLVMVSGVFLGISLGILSLTFLGFVIKPFYSKVKKRFPRGALVHRLYWNLPTQSFRRMGKFNNMPASHIREIVL
jgi:type IV conjugative transfer system protein TraL